MIEIIQTIPHDTMAFTQGYFFKDKFLYESTGLYGKSSLRKVNPLNGDVIKKVDIDKKYFAEGIEFYEDSIYMLTWKEQTCKVFDFEFNEIKQFNYSGEGWGLSLQKDKFYMSDGTNIIKIIDPKSFNVIGKIEIFDNKVPLAKINELQSVNEYILANIWYTDKVAVLLDGKLDRFLDLSFLRNYLKNKRAEVMNGIAYDNLENVLYVTGKFWDLVFKLKINHL